LAKADREGIPRLEKGKPEDFKRAPLIAVAPKGRGFTPRIREYVYQLNKVPVGSRAPVPDTLLWKPAVIAADGTAQVEFDLPRSAATYRVRVEGHTSGGRLGTVQRTLEVRAEGMGVTK
jgi:hypothetical protein